MSFTSCHWKSIKKSCQHEHQENALMIDICLFLLCSLQAFYRQQSSAGLHNMNNHRFWRQCILACLVLDPGESFLNDKMLHQIQLKQIYRQGNCIHTSSDNETKLTFISDGCWGDEEWQRAQRGLVGRCQRWERSSAEFNFMQMQQRRGAVVMKGTCSLNIAPQ